MTVPNRHRSYDSFSAFITSLRENGEQHFANYQQALEAAPPAVPIAAPQVAIVIEPPPAALAAPPNVLEAAGDAGAANGDNDMHNCPVCLTTIKQVALVPCGHMICSGCQTVLERTVAPAAVDCPICRRTVQLFQRVYM